MSPAEAIAKYLRTEGAATMAVVDARTYWPYSTTEPTAPYVIVRLASTSRLAVTLQGAGQPREHSVEITCFARTQSGAWAVADAVRSDLDNHAGATPSTGGIALKRCYCSDESEVIEAGLFEAGLFAVQQTYTVTT